MSENTVEKPKSGFRGGDAAINRAGRKPKDGTEEKPTNREIRERALLELCRKFKPLQTRAIQTALKIMENEQGADQNRLKAAVFLSQTYRQLLIDTFNKDYDEDEGEEIQQGPKAPVFSLTMINSPEDNK